MSGVFCKPIPTFPYVLAARWTRDMEKRPDWEQQLFHELMHLAKKAYEIEGLFIALRDDNTRLRHENEFMLKLVEARE